MNSQPKRTEVPLGTRTALAQWLLFGALLGLPSCEDSGAGSSVDAGDAAMIPVVPPGELAEISHCGDDSLEAGEECDDGNRRAGDGCDPICRVEVGSDGVDAGASPPASCGNGKLEARRGEQCDDGNNAAGDGCGSFCLEEPACGNGVVEPGEQCEPPGTAQCDDACIGIAADDRGKCGDGFLGGFESCDDGNRRDGDGCSRYCTESPVCGNGEVEHGEDCEPPGVGTCEEDCSYPGEPGCGNARLDDYVVVLFGTATRITEECDDGNLDDADGCDSDCRVSHGECGNGVKEPREKCDDGNTADGDGCNSRCRIEDEGPDCPNGVVEEGEECDDGNFFNGDGCSTSCESDGASCPNGVEEEGEECDDGNFFNGDGCTSRCLIEAACGDGSRDPGEQCDDGNLEDGDGCTADCLNEVILAAWPSSTIPCGNGTVDAGEGCDDGNRISGDGCSPTCQTFECGDGVRNGDEACDDGTNRTVYERTGAGCGYFCQRPGYCGDGERQYEHERCDDGNTTNGDGCSAQCERESTCGNGIIEFDEECDDPNDLATTFTCAGDCTVVAPADCGDRVVDAESETCDDGNFIPGDGCSASCQLEVCGNHVLDPGEECEEALDVDVDGGAGSETEGWVDCSSTCVVLPECGDGFLSPGEECDDENDANGDGCSDACAIEPRCGDGYEDPDEECDDRGTQSGDGCSATCEDEGVCGNGALDVAEQCDDGNLQNGDDCSSKCRIVQKATPVATGLRNGDFDDDVAFWAATDAAVTLSRNTANDVAGSTSSGSLQVRFWETRDSATRATTGAAQCIPVLPGQVYDVSVFAQIGTNEPPSTRANVFARFYPSATCTGTLITPTPSWSTGIRGQWVELGGDVTVPEGSGSLQVRLEVSKIYADGAAIVLYDGIALELDGVGGEEPVARCGDLLINVAGEECDDGNSMGGDGCDVGCRNEPVCGDGLLASTELCDDGNLVNGDACSLNCHPAPVCGDGVTAASEGCDDGNLLNEDGCSRLCHEESLCGDGLLVEEDCDDGNTTSLDGCSSRCEIEAVCGNGEVEGADQPENAPWWRREQCDDGNVVSDDGCSQLCTLETAGSSCGNGILQPSLGEQCEYSPSSTHSLMCRGNCTESCLACRLDECPTLEEQCAHATGVAAAGPGVGRRRAELCMELLACMQANESECKNTEDDGPWSAEACLCGIASATQPLSIDQHVQCRDGVVPADGSCAEFMAAAAETTDPRLILERLGEPEVVVGAAFALAECTSFSCAGPCTVVCGDGLVEGFEECDDGNDVDTDSCADCLSVGCGNGRRDPGEVCDYENPEDAETCNTDCTPKLGCGDKVLNGHLLEGAELPLLADGGVNTAIEFIDEECDDGNRRDGDGCNASCAHEYCGDGIHQPDLTIRPWDGQGEPPPIILIGDGEECDGSAIDGVPCTEGCKLEFGCEQCIATRCEAETAMIEACTEQRCPLIENLSSCLESSGCAYAQDGRPGEGLELPCYCGTMSPIDCFAPGYANGPCKTQFEGAAQSTKPNDVLVTALVNSEYALGQVMQLYACKAQHCSPECTR